MFTEAIEVACTPAGVPLRVRWKGREFRLTAEPFRWFERRKWWDEGLRVPRGIGAGLVDYEMWRLQIAPADSRASGQTIDVSFDPQSTRWRVVKLHHELPSAA